MRFSRITTIATIAILTSAVLVTATPAGADPPVKASPDARFAVVRPAPNNNVIPNAPTNVTVTVSGSAATLTWTPPATNYSFAAVYRAISSSATFNLLAYSAFGATSYTDTASLGPGSCYQVSAVSNAGFESSKVQVCTPAATTTVLFDKTNAAFDAGQCDFGIPEFSGSTNEKVCGQSFSTSVSFKPTSFDVRLYVTGIATDGVVVEIRQNVSGMPGSTVLATSDPLLASAIPPVSGGDAGIVTLTFSTTSTLPAGSYWLVARSTGGVSTDREYHILMTFDLISGTQVGIGTYDAATNTFPSWSDSAKMWRAKFTVSQ